MKTTIFCRKPSVLLVTLVLLARLSLVVGRGEETNHVAEAVPPGYRLIEGDILVREEPQFAPAGVFPRTSFWPGGIVRFQFDANVTAANQNNMLDAMAEWEAVANVVFLPRNGASDYLQIRNSTGNSSHVGRQGGQQIVNISSWGSLFTMVHELGHALGLWHEQSRSDRDQYIEVHLENVAEEDRHNFDVHDEASHYGPYDFASVMHYSSGAFSINGQPSIVVLPPYDTDWQNEIGQRDDLSYWDATIMSFLYPINNWRFADDSNPSSGNGTFLNPFRLVSTATNSVPSGGTIWFDPGIYPAVGTYGKPMTWRSALGGVRLQ